MDRRNRQNLTSLSHFFAFDSLSSDRLLGEWFLQRCRRSVCVSFFMIPAYWVFVLNLSCAICMDEMCQDLGMPGYFKNAGRLIRSVEAFEISLAREGSVQVAIENRSI